MHPVNVAMSFFQYEPVDETTRYQLEEYLNDNWPEALWFVSIKGDKLFVDIKFASLKEETFYTLKWA